MNWLDCLCSAVLWLEDIMGLGLKDKISDKFFILVSPCHCPPYRPPRNPSPDQNRKEVLYRI